MNFQKETIYLSNIIELVISIHVKKTRGLSDGLSSYSCVKSSRSSGRALGSSQQRRWAVDAQVVPHTVPGNLMLASVHE